MIKRKIRLGLQNNLLARKRHTRRYSVYLLECLDGSIYTGITTDVERRFREHQAGKGARYTRAHGAKSILYRECCPNRSLAQMREAELKKLSRTEKLQVSKHQALLALFQKVD